MAHPLHYRKCIYCLPFSSFFFFSPLFGRYREVRRSQAHSRLRCPPRLADVQGRALLLSSLPPWIFNYIALPLRDAVLPDHDLLDKGALTRLSRNSLRSTLYPYVILMEKHFHCKLKFKTYYTMRSSMTSRVKTQYSTLLLCILRNK